MSIRIAVNISARLLQDTSFPALLSGLLRDAGIPPQLLEVEITESAMMLDPSRAQRVVHEIHALKLDKSFVLGMRRNRDDRVIVESTAQMAHALELELVAEGVESEWEARALARAGYDYAQGFHFTRALPATPCLAWIQEFNAAAGSAHAIAV